MNVQIIFPSFLAVKELDIDNKVIEDFCYRKEKECKKIKYLGGWQSSDPFLDEPEVQPILTAIDRCLVGVQDMFGFTEEAKPYVANGWININNPGNYGLNNNPPHIHANYLASAVYYVKAEQKSGDLTLIPPFNSVEYAVPYGSFNRQTIYNSSRWTVDPVPGKLIIFPSWLMHYVNGNLSQSDRISMAFNIRLPAIVHKDY
jgi:uncharacterized protein (TIGR02466 family)